MRIEVLVGMIGSGKSCYADRRAGEGALVICHDAIVHGLHSGRTYEQPLRTMYHAMEQVLAALALQQNRDIIIDRNHLTCESRNRWLSFARSVASSLPGDLSILAVPFPVESAETHARRRFASDPRGRTYEEWLAVAEHHAEQARLEPLDWRAEGFDGVVDPATVPLVSLIEEVSS